MPQEFTHTQDSALLNSTVSLDRNRSWLPVTASVLSSNCSNCAQFQVLRVQRHGCGKEDQHQVQQSRHRESERSKFPNVSSLFWGSSSWLFNSYLKRVFYSFLMISPDFRGSSVLKSKLAKRQQVHWALRLDMAGPSQIVLPSVTYVSVILVHVWIPGHIALRHMTPCWLHFFFLRTLDSDISGSNSQSIQVPLALQIVYE